jgi:hypothetical protein
VVVKHRGVSTEDKNYLEKKKKEKKKIELS